MKFAARFAVIGLLYLLLFAALPALRLDIFGTEFKLYYAVRAVGFLIFCLAIWCFPRGAGQELSVGSVTPVNTGYGDPLLTLRAMACMIVLLGHGLGIQLAPADLIQRETLSRLFWIFLPLAWSGVWIFFTLSGYLMGKGFFTGRYSFSRSGILNFYRNRALRIIPLAYFAILTVTIFTRPDLFKIDTIKYLVALLMFDYDGYTPASPIGLLWSIATEMQFYAMAPFLAFAIYIAAKRINFFILPLCFVIYGLAYRLGWLYLPASFEVQTWTVSVYTPLLGNLDAFGLGMCASFIVQRFPIRWPRLSHGLFLMAAMYIISAAVCSRAVTTQEWVLPAMYYSPSFFFIATAAIIIVLENAARSDFMPGVIYRKAIYYTQTIGVLSYAIYLWHTPIFGAFAKVMSQPIKYPDTISALIVAGAVVLIFSWITHRAIEVPFEKMKKHIFKDDREARDIAGTKSARSNDQPQMALPPLVG